MCYREMQETYELQHLSIHSTKSVHSKGRVISEAPCSIRTCFQRDRDRILHSKAFRRLAHKTQVFIAPEGDHYRTRLTHTLEVAQIARTLARALRLNEDLTEAIALGHDLGHTPFGHTGEHVLQKLTNNSFSHNKQSIRIVEMLENKGKGLNLTFEVKDGILNHQTAAHPTTLEGQVVQISDKIAYINHDIDDAIRGKVLQASDLPPICLERLGSRSSSRINTIIMDIIQESTNKTHITMSESIEEAFYLTRKFLFQHVYIGSKAKEQDDKAKHILEQLYYYYMNNPNQLPSFNEAASLDKSFLSQQVCDHIAGMTDRYAIHQYCELFFPTSWNIY